LDRLDVLEACLLDTGNKNMARTVHEISNDMRCHCAFPAKSMRGED
jgi:hypothetical protein